MVGLMEIEFQNIGFIKKGKIKTNNITVIFGPNNVGKTYLSYSTYAAISKYNVFFKEKIKVPKAVSSDLVLNGTAKYDITNVFTDELVKSVNDDISSSLPAFFKDSSGMFSKSKINVIDDYIQERVINAEVDVNVSLRENVILNIRKEKHNTCVVFSVVYKNKNIESRFDGLKEKDASQYLNLLFNFFFLNEVLDSAANDAFIITSERTGISLFQKEIDGNRSNIVDSYMWKTLSNKNLSNERLMSIDDIMSRKVAKFSEPINHNINIIRGFSDQKEMDYLMKASGLRRNKKTRDYVIETLETLTGGKYSSSDGEAIYTVSCNDGDKISMPLSLSSASNKALFLLDLYVRYYMSANSYLIIDEPELNLHPHNQIKMAELLVRLSNCGVKIIITTHSDYIVKEINNRIMASQLQNKAKLSEFKYKDIDVISDSEVNSFTIGKDGIITEIEGNKYGVNAFLFDNVISNIEDVADRLYTYLEEGL